MKQMEKDAEEISKHDMIIRFPDHVPPTEFSHTFVQGMANRMATSYSKYGAVKDAYPARVDAIRSLLLRLDRYERDGNTEHLIDAANYCMIEFMAPKHPEAHFAPTDTKGSPGRAWKGEIDPSQRANIPERWND